MRGGLLEFRTDVALFDKKSRRQVSDVVRMTFLQLPLFRTDDPENCKNDFERWIYTLKKHGDNGTNALRHTQCSIPKTGGGFDNRRNDP